MTGKSSGKPSSSEARSWKVRSWIRLREEQVRCRAAATQALPDHLLSRLVPRFSPESRCAKHGGGVVLDLPCRSSLCKELEDKSTTCARQNCWQDMCTSYLARYRA